MFLEKLKEFCKNSTIFWLKKLSGLDLKVATPRTQKLKDKKINKIGCHLQFVYTQYVLYVLSRS